MLRKMKLLSVLFICTMVLLTGCGGSSLPYKQGDTYKEGNDTFIEVQADDEWKVNGRRDRSAVYKVEPTEYKDGQYSVVAISIKQKFSDKDPLLIMNDYEYFLLAPTEDGFSSLKVGTSHPSSNEWKEFKEEYEKAGDKEEFLEKEAERSENRADKYVKTN